MKESFSNPEPSHAWTMYIARNVLLLVTLLGFAAMVPACRDAADSDSYGECPSNSERTPDTAEDAAFSKPEFSSRWEDLRKGLTPDEWEPGATFQNQFRRAFFPRDHMHPTENASELWLYEGEHAVIDVGMWWAGEDLPEELRYDLMVFVDLRPVEFGFIEVDPRPDVEPLPTLEEARNHTPLEHSVRLETREGEPLAFTIAIPPDAFGEVGAHDVRIAFVPDDRGKGTDSNGVPVLTRGPSFVVTANYGGTRFVAEDSLEELDARMTDPPGDVDAYLSRPDIFVNPPIEVENLKSTDISQSFVVSDEQISLRGWVENAGAFSRADEWAVVVLDGYDPLEEIRGKVSLPKAPPPPGISTPEPTEANYAAEFDIPISIDDSDMHSIRAFAFSMPFCRRGYNDLGGVSASNIVHLKRDESTL